MHNQLNRSLVIVQRELMGYRYELIKNLSNSFITTKIACAKSHVSDPQDVDNVTISVKRCFKTRIKGDTRSANIYFMPSLLRDIVHCDVLLVEGTTNILNNVFCVPFARILNKKIIWWDAGYSPTLRTFRRKVIDKCVSMLMPFTHAQIAYSNKAKKYIVQYMGAKNCTVLLNTIDTSYFEEISDQIIENNTLVERERPERKEIKLLFVGIVEKRKKIKELIDVVGSLQIKGREIQLQVVGGGDYLDFLKDYVEQCGFNNVIFSGPIYDKEELKTIYFNSDLFVMPGDGGLGVLQSMLYGLPCVCCSADGTEEDYFGEEKELRVFSDLNTLIHLLEDESIYNRVDIIEFLTRVSSSHWINGFLQICNDDC